MNPTNFILSLILIAGIFSATYLILQLNNKEVLHKLYIKLIKRGLTYTQFMYVYVLAIIAIVFTCIYIIINLS